MGVLIDASVLIAWERGELEVPATEGREDDPFLLSMITVSELLHGVHRARQRLQRARRSAFVEAVIDRFPLLPVDLPTARAHAQLWADLTVRGEMIGPHDLWLAAAAIAHDLSLVTTNVREFGRIPGLRLEDWSAA